MHLFQIEYITNHASGTVQQGKVVLLADSHEQAQNSLCAYLNLPASRTRIMESFKLKPPIYEISQREFQQNAKPRRPPEERAPPERYDFTVQVTNIFAHSTHQALRKLGEELMARGSQRPLVHNLQVSIDTSVSEAKLNGRAPRSTLEQIEFYRPATKPMQGGRTSRR